MTQEEYLEWRNSYDLACQSLKNRERKISKSIETLEVNMGLLGITGVEDMLQDDIRNTLESLREAGIQTWMLTGDKMETAVCIAISTGLKSIKHSIFQMKELIDPVEISNMLMEFSNKLNYVLVIDGETLGIALQFCEKNFFDAACKAPSVICCRCAPTQKALVTEGVKKYTGKNTCAIGDGGNDVGMIQAADVGIGVEGKEGKQAALAADFSITQFSYLLRLLLWHGRLSYKRSAILSQFVIHRGFIISSIQFVFSCIFYYVSISIYGGYLLLGYTTIFTMFPVFSLVNS